MVVVGISRCQYLKVLACVVTASLVLLFVLTSPPAGQQKPEKRQDWEQQLEMLRAIPYVALSESLADDGERGVVYHDSEKAFQGYNFYCTLFSGDAFLLDMDGQVVHQWAYPYHQRKHGTDHAVMLQNGHLLLLKEFRELILLSWNSKLIWRKSLPVHHDATEAPDGSFYAIIRLRREYRGLKVYFPAIVHLATNGQEIDRWSSYDHLNEIKRVFNTRSFLDNILDRALVSGLPQPGPSDKIKEDRKLSGTYYDYFHMNTISLIPDNVSGQKDSRFRQGNLLVCFRNVNQIAVLEKDTYRILWAWGEGELEWPHHPTMLENGRILIFDNGVRRRYSRVVEFDPVVDAIVWEHTAEPPESFFTHSRGGVQRLPNGNTLICESEKGHVFEVTEDGEVVWTWLNPNIWEEEATWARLSPAGGQQRTVRRSEILYRMSRVPKAEVEPLLSRWWWE
jgi:hypothetical protein